IESGSVPTGSHFQPWRLESDCSPKSHVDVGLGSVGEIFTNYKILRHTIPRALSLPHLIHIILDLLQPKSRFAAAKSKCLLIRLKFAASARICSLKRLHCIGKAKLGGGCHDHNVMLALWRKKVEFLELQDLVKDEQELEVGSSTR
ncbi:hypothetical protein C5167_002410, partial [Papaver somniferum]